MHPTVPLDGGSAEGNPSCAVGGRHGHPGRSYLPVMLSTGATARCEVAVVLGHVEYNIYTTIYLCTKHVPSVTMLGSLRWPLPVPYRIIHTV